MKSKKNIITLLSVFIFFISFIIYKDNSDTVYANINKSKLIKSDIDFIKERCNNKEKIMCEFYEITNNAIKGEIDDVMKYMEKIENNSSSYPIECHTFAHTIGKIFYYHIGLKNSILTKNICVAGIYHGAFEEWGTNTDFNIVKKEITNICDEKDKNSAAYNLCIHGAGRALYRSKNDVKAGADGCLEGFLNNKDNQECFIGVLSSHILMEIADKNEVENNYLDKLIKECEMINNKYIHSCISVSMMEYLKQMYLWKMPIKDKDELLDHFVDKYIIFCQNLDKIISKQACAQGIGTSIIDTVATFESELFKSRENKYNEYSDKEIYRAVDKEDLLKSMYVCTEFNERFIGDCIGGAVIWVLSHLADAKFAEELCNISNTDKICLNLKNQINTYTKLN